MKITLEEICEKTGCTVQDIVEAMVSQSKNNQRIIVEAKKEKELQTKETLASMKALEVQNTKLRALIDNHHLSNEWMRIVAEIKSAEGEKKAEEASKIIVP
jgi:antitoxin component of RelBE/YafQ-DinJ toxin-antitoxin module